MMDRFWRLRDRLLANPRMQTLAVAFPFLRPIANRRARQIFDLCIGFVHTQVVTAVVELGVLDLLAERPLTALDVAEKTGLERDPAERLLRAAAALTLIVRNRDQTYRLSELGAAIRGAPGVVEIIRHNQVFYRDLADPIGLLQGRGGPTELSRYWPYAEGADGVAGLSESETTPYSELMAASQPFIADDVCAAFDFRRHTRLLDVGGGDGTFVARVAERYPSLAIGVLDLPSVATRATKNFQARGLGARAAVHGSDFHRDAFPEGYDAISLVRILLDHDDAAALNVLKKAREALVPGGVVLVAELMSEAPGAETISDAYFGLYLFAMGRGRPRSVTRIRELLVEAGFENARAIPTRRPLMTQLVVGNVASG